MYIYPPLGCTPAATADARAAVRNMVLVFPLCALLPWHGAAAAAVDFALAKPKNVLFIAVRP